MYFLFSLNSILSYSCFFFIFKNIICSEDKLNYNSCKKYIKSFDIICTNITKADNGTIICNDWYAKNSSDITLIPDVCKNKKYKLELLYENLDKTTKINCSLYINKDFIINLKELELDNYMNKEEEINYCLKYYKKFHQSCSSNNDSNILNEECQSLRNNYLNNINESVFCIDFILKGITNFEKKVNTIIKKNNKFKDYKINVEPNEKKNKNTFKQNEYKEKYTYFDSEEISPQKIEAIKKENDKELKNKHKDCVEYGLNSLNEDIIVCLKYE